MIALPLLPPQKMASPPPRHSSSSSLPGPSVDCRSLCSHVAALASSRCHHLVNPSADCLSRFETSLGTRDSSSIVADPSTLSDNNRLSWEPTMRGYPSRVYVLCKGPRRRRQSAPFRHEPPRLMRERDRRRSGGAKGLVGHRHGPRCDDHRRRWRLLLLLQLGRRRLTRPRVQVVPRQVQRQTRQVEFTLGPTTVLEEAARVQALVLRERLRSRVASLEAGLLVAHVRFSTAQLDEEQFYARISKFDAVKPSIS
ncbi:unnamed protein product [Notodromas monacha]|uniref:Uncharacterized protein n=1 Tax=Notodromas monacha TaxID=399045 RepID=A0A7R9BP53_9CRUS|nr:unnamed protein product [Notodromas monacha]CAG0918226.1 unnamed protein product [Notodromas monacha]